jgi:hypothetical protein
MRTITVLLFISVHLASWGQNKIDPTNEFNIVGLGQKEIRVTVSDLLKLKPIKLDDIVITNHLGDKKGTASGLSGIPIKEIFEGMQFNEDNPKSLSQYYLVFVASDGYKVVYSWNEIFNTSTGENTFIIIEKDNKKIADMEDRILVVTRTDFKTGRRFIKGLSKIIVQKVP